MDFLIELAFEIILEGTLEIGTSRKVPLPLRILAFLLILAVYGSLTVVLFLCGLNAMQEKKTAVGVLFFVVALGIIFGSIYVIIKKSRERR